MDAGTGVQCVILRVKGCIGVYRLPLRELRRILASSLRFLFVCAVSQIRFLWGGGGGSARDLYSSDPDYLNIFFSLIIPTIFSYRQRRDGSMAITKEILAHGTGEWVKRHFWTKWAGKQKFDSIWSRFNGNLP